MRFVDTNVLIYAASPSAEDAEGRRRAQDLLREGGLAVSVQVLQEFYWQVTRATRADPLSPSLALRFIESIREFPVQDVTLAVFRAGVARGQRLRLSYWDGAILAAARACGCDAVYSEDLRNARENSDDANARIEHDKVLARIVTGMVKDDAELFKQFMDNDDFKRWMTATVFELACEQAGAP